MTEKEKNWSETKKKFGRQNFPDVYLCASQLSIGTPISTIYIYEIFVHSILYTTKKTELFTTKQAKKANTHHTILSRKKCKRPAQVACRWFLVYDATFYVGTYFYLIHHYHYVIWTLTLQPCWLELEVAGDWITASQTT
jgi:hypothetical protein